MAEITPEQRMQMLERQVHKHMVSIAVLSLIVIGLSVLTAFTVFVGTLPWVTPKRIHAEEILAKKAVVVKSGDDDKAFVYIHSINPGAGITIRGTNGDPALSFHTYRDEPGENERQLRVYNHDGQLIWSAPPSSLLKPQTQTENDESPNQ